jgi:hypothetical protein
MNIAIKATTLACDNCDGLFGPLRGLPGAAAILSTPDNSDAAPERRGRFNPRPNAFADAWR